MASILIAGGLAALALMPRAGWGWTIPPQLLVGAGLGLTVGGLTELALAGRAEQVVHGGWTIAARTRASSSGCSCWRPC